MEQVYQALITLDGWTFLAQICNLMIQLVIFKKLLLNPVKKVNDLGDGGLGGGGVADHPDDLRQSGIFAHAGGLAPQKARLVGGGG